MQRRKGFSLIEVIVSLAILSVISVGIMTALANASNSTVVADELDTARSLAQSQMEYVKKQAFSASYTPDAIPASYTGFSVSINAVPASQRDGLIQFITVTVQRYGNTVTTLQDCKARR
jgi:prepilin-type N-terminal cleavage/methylation domain-containing protein